MGSSRRHQHEAVYALAVLSIAIALLLASEALLGRAGARPGTRMEQVRSGLETWFTLPDMPGAMTPPARWKMALVTWLALLPMAIPVAMLTWVVMPRLSRVLNRWLYAS